MTKEPIDLPFGREAWKRRPIEPGPVDGEPRAVRWSVATGDLPVGRVTRAPGTLGPLLEYGVLTRMEIERDAVVTWLVEGQDWLDQGPRIRDAVNSTLDLDGWVVAGP